jgi:glycosyltransferase involved in cell wall biosynthesis
MRVLLNIDYPGWAYDIIASGIIKFSKLNNHNIKFDKVYYCDFKCYSGKIPINGYKKYDKIHHFGPRGINMFVKRKMVDKKERHIVSVGSERERALEYCKNCTPYTRCFIAASRNVKHKLEKICKESRIVYIPNGIDYDFFNKHFDTKKARTRFEEKILGHVSSHKMIKNYKDVIEFAVQGRPFITNKGIINQRKLIYLYDRMYFHLWASQSEGCGLPILETSAMGIPNISTIVGIAPDFMIHNVNGYCIEDWNKGYKPNAQGINVFKNFIEIALGLSFKRYQEIAVEATKAVKKYDWQYILPNIVKLYEN